MVFNKNFCVVTIREIWHTDIMFSLTRILTGVADIAQYVTLRDQLIFCPPIDIGIGAIDSVARWLWSGQPDTAADGGHMDRKQIVLAAMSPAGGEPYTPVMVQKLLFLIDREIPEETSGPHFEFYPYDYGPFDSGVYSALESLESLGYVEKYKFKTWSNYRLTPEGQKAASAVFDGLNDTAQDFVKRASDFVRRLSFTQLVAAIYKAYPEMKKNSVFR